MSIPNRQIGQASSTEAALLHDILKDIDRLIKVISVSGGGGGGSGTVTSVSVASANGFAGSVSNPTTTPAITFSTSVFGILFGNGTSVAAAVAGNFPTLNQNTTGSAAALTNGRTIAITGDVTYTSPSFNGSSNVTAAGTVTRINGTSLAGLATGILKNTTATGVPSIAVAGTDYLAPGGSGAGLTDVWLSASGTTLTGVNTIIGTNTNLLNFRFNSVGVATTIDQFRIVNETAAALGAQQSSPLFVLEGKGWATTGSTSQIVKFAQRVLPVQGATNPTAIWGLAYSINGAAYTDIMTANTSGNQIVFPGAVSVASIATTGTASFAGASAASGTTVSITKPFSAFSSATSFSIAPSTVSLASGTANYQALSITSVINYTGSASGVVTGIDYNPTLTSIIGVSHLSIRTTSGSLQFTQGVLTSGWIPALKSTAGAHTGMTASTEFISNDFTGATQTWLTGTVGTQRDTYFRAYTHSGANPTTFTNLFNVYIEAPLITGAGVTATNGPYALGLNGNLNLVTAGNKIFIKEGSNGSLGQSTLVAGTRSITISGITTSTRAFVQLVTPSGTTLTTSYQAVCTANTLTIQANVAAGTINTADVSTFNYIIIEPTP